MNKNTFEARKYGKQIDRTPRGVLSTKGLPEREYHALQCPKALLGPKAPCNCGLARPTGPKESSVPVLLTGETGEFAVLALRAKLYHEAYVQWQAVGCPPNATFSPSEYEAMMHVDGIRVPFGYMNICPRCGYHSDGVECPYCTSSGRPKVDTGYRHKAA